MANVFDTSHTVDQASNKRGVKVQVLAVFEEGSGPSGRKTSLKK